MYLLYVKKFQVEAHYDFSLDTQNNILKKHEIC